MDIRPRSSPDPTAATAATAAYEAVASHYYDAALHPTCAAFRAGSLDLLRAALPSAPPDGSVVELGAGRASVPEAAGWWRERALVLVDGSATMLAYSADVAGGARLLTADARRTGLAPGSAGVVVAGLADPYNDASLWAEIRRLLRPDGVAVVTTPSHEWARHFRPRGQRADQNNAEFAAPDGRERALPSFILPRDAQRAMIEAAGLVVAAIEGRSADQVPLAALAPKLRVVPAGATFVDAYVCRVG